jgi:hypothetical protein
MLKDRAILILRETFGPGMGRVSDAALTVPTGARIVAHLVTVPA